jgi:integrase
LGNYPEMSLTQAKKAATTELAKIIQGIDPTAERRARVIAQQRKEHEAFTLRQAMENHISFMEAKKCAPRSIESVRDEVTRLLAAWLDNPLMEISRKDCIERHRKLTEERGPVAANRALRCVRACWRSAQRLFEHLPPHPVFVVYNKQSRKRSPIPWEQLPAWWAEIEAMENGVRRDLNFLALFTGLRSEDARTIRWEHVDFNKGTLHRPKPKGGEDRAFTIPLSAHLLAILAKRQLDNRMRFGDDGGWVFATRKVDGSITHTKDARKTNYVEDADGKLHKVTKLPTMHRLRDTFATACLESGVGFTETKVLMNHSLAGGDVTQGYQRPSMEHLRGCAEKVAVFLLGKAEVAAQTTIPVRKGA